MISPVQTDYTPEQVADQLRVHRQTVYNLIARKQLAAYKVGRVLRVTAQALEEFRAGGPGKPARTRREPSLADRLRDQAEALAVLAAK